MRRKTFGNWQDRAAWILICLSLAILLLPPRTKYVLSVSMQTVLLAPLRGLAVLQQRFGSLESENRRLSRMATELAVENARLRSALGRLAEMPGVKYELVRAPLISRDLATMKRWLVIARGRNHGVFPGAPVLAPEGVVGKVVSAGKHQSLVQTILDPESKLGVIDLRSDVLGLCGSAGRDMLRIDYTAKGSDLLVGDTVVTAGLGRVFPGGLPVGIVASVDELPAELFPSVRVRPFADISKLNQVFVFKTAAPAESLWDDPWLENLAPEEIRTTRPPEGW